MARPLDSGAKKHRHKGRSLTIREWAAEIDVPRQTIITRERRELAKARSEGRDTLSRAQIAKVLAPRYAPRTLTAGGRTMTVSEWSAENDVPINTIKDRKRMGCSDSEAVDPDYERRG